ncbi:hypothetical protein C0Q70_12906 [Pomacea canaliculata]|uniref:Uncharacterized protein n=1 Tax=Pomacea canaliculata TaxID=400727 RepID=A0A2T7P2U0_POMCA|nr:hypothetical protein C0Q70_12906 [Pomacea canaliculata]
MPPPFRSMIRADGFAEVWSNNGQDKLKQFGWRCTNNESNYELDTLIGNWSEEKHRHPHAFPHHQPELDTPKLKEIYNSWETTMRASYMDPRGRKNPIIPVGKE